jgi:hypothetical protein
VLALWLGVIVLDTVAACERVSVWLNVGNCEAVGVCVRLGCWLELRVAVPLSLWESVCVGVAERVKPVLTEGEADWLALRDWLEEADNETDGAWVFDCDELGEHALLRVCDRLALLDWLGEAEPVRERAPEAVCDWLGLCDCDALSLWLLDGTCETDCDALTVALEVRVCNTLVVRLGDCDRELDWLDVRERDGDDD